MQRWRKVGLALSGSMVGLAIYGSIYDNGDGRQLLWIIVLGLAVALLWSWS